MPLLFCLKKSKYLLFFVLFSLCKIIASAGQTLFSVHYGLNYLFKNLSEERSLDIVSIFAAFATLVVVTVTRVPAMYTMFKADSIKKETISLEGRSFSQQSLYYFLVGFNVISGFFSSVGAYLGIITILEYTVAKTDLLTFSMHQMIGVQLLALMVSVSCFISYYAFNIQKAKLNAFHLVEYLKSHQVFFRWNQKMLKTFFISILNIISLPFITYFLTSNAILKLPLLPACLSGSVIQMIAIFSGIAALISSLSTTIVSMYEYLGAEKNGEIEPSQVSVLRYGTYIAGLVDSGANGLSSFLGVMNVCKNVIQVSSYSQFVMLFAIGCGLSSALLNFNFSVRQGFNDVVKLLTFPTVKLRFVQHQPGQF